MSDTGAVNGAYGGGDVILKPGRGGIPRRAASDCESPRDGSIVFQDANDQELMRLESGGKIYIRGTQVDDDDRVYATFLEWLVMAEVIR